VRRTLRSTSIVFNDRCDMIVTTAVLPQDRLVTMEPKVMEFLIAAPFCSGLKPPSGSDPPIGQIGMPISDLYHTRSAPSGRAATACDLPGGAAGGQGAHEITIDEAEAISVGDW
jgi:hypothetical protein